MFTVKPKNATFINLLDLFVDINDTDRFAIMVLMNNHIEIKTYEMKNIYAFLEAINSIRTNWHSLYQHHDKELLPIVEEIRTRINAATDAHVSFIRINC